MPATRKKPTTSFIKQSKTPVVLIHATYVQNLKYILRDGVLKPLFDIGFGSKNNKESGWKNNYHGMGYEELYEEHSKESGTFSKSVPFRNFVYTELVQYDSEHPLKTIFGVGDMAILVFDARVLLHESWGYSDGHNVGLDRTVVDNKSHKTYSQLTAFLRKNITHRNEITFDNHLSLIPYLQQIYIQTWKGEKKIIQGLLSQKYPHVEVFKHNRRQLFSIYRSPSTLEFFDGHRNVKKYYNKTWKNPDDVK